MKRVMIGLATAAAAKRGRRLEEPECSYAMEVMLLQDVSHSYLNDLPNLQEFIPEFFESLLVDYPGSTFGLASFSDKPDEQLGWRDEPMIDHCKETLVSLTTDVDSVTEALYDIYIKSGRDLAESQLDMMLHAALNDSIGWSGDTHTSLGDPLVKVMIVATDAPYHVKGDARSAAVYDPERRAQYVDSNLDGNVECDHEDYPSVPEMAEIIKREDFFMIFLVTKDVFRVYEELLGALGVDGVVSMVDDDSTDVLEALDRALKELDATQCGVVVPGECEMPIDVKHLHHTLNIPETKLGIFQSLADDAFKDLTERYPGSEMGVFGFSDRPITPHGYEGWDSCYVVGSELTDSRSEYYYGVQTLSLLPGSDYPDSHLQSLYHATVSSWTPSARDPESFHGRVMFFVPTWNVVHKPGAALHIEGAIPHDGSTRLGCSCDDYDAVDDCLILDYPSMEMVGQALLDREVFLVIYTYPLMVPYFDDFLAELGVPGIVVPDENGSLTYRQDFNSIIDYVAKHHYCPLMPEPEPTLPPIPPILPGRSTTTVAPPLVTDPETEEEPTGEVPTDLPEETEEEPTGEVPTDMPEETEEEESDPTGEVPTDIPEESDPTEVVPPGETDEEPTGEVPTDIPEETEEEPTGEVPTDIPEETEEEESDPTGEVPTDIPEETEEEESDPTEVVPPGETEESDPEVPPTDEEPTGTVPEETEEEEETGEVEPTEPMRPMPSSTTPTPTELQPTDPVEEEEDDITPVVVGVAVGGAALLAAGGVAAYMGIGSVGTGGAAAVEGVVEGGEMVTDPFERDVVRDITDQDYF